MKYTVGQKFNVSAARKEIGAVKIISKLDSVEDEKVEE